ncbi:GNAT family N-acetyltransferase [Phytohabitans sp. ZYX-F-186]|uniref:GNAT family N-acetyltransferase n=1 Tax=Phytohabitans maris TaxID=3071409 RepID=A0ABU0ZDJ6_9ACTN|nr:GNAT family N-acetyltransferase [Phytohabitans sp. ZYX-F-186]MDQ7905131.1 GNAT family N-acetyltransferase [Phytohabitans sp. ZYX-F-186]
MGVVTAGYTVRQVGWDDAGAVRLRALMAQEILPRYAGLDLSAQRVTPPRAEDVVATFVAYQGVAPVATASLVTVGRYHEVKRVVVDPGHRRQGLARALISAIEGLAAERGIEELVLQTGIRQPEAIGLYESLGWRRIPPFGPYERDTVVSVCFGKRIAATAAAERHDG